jgi:hypothetical protein
MANSKNTQEITAVGIEIKAEMPNTTIENIQAGRRAISTLHINFRVFVSD